MEAYADAVASVVATGRCFHGYTNSTRRIFVSHDNTYTDLDIALVESNVPKEKLMEKTLENLRCKLSTVVLR